MGIIHRWKASALPRPFSFVSVDIIEMSPSFRSQIVHLSFVVVGHSGKTKKPAYFAVSRVGKFYGSSVTCLPPVYPNSFRGLALYATWIGQG